MTATCIRWLLLVLGGTCRAVSPSAEGELRLAVDKLWNAGNYRWEEKRVIDIDSLHRVPARVPAMGRGETVIGDFTVATIERRQVVMQGTETAFLLSAGWRHSQDLTDAEIAELRIFGAGTRRGEERAHNFTRSLPHELLRWFLAIGRNIRREGAVIVGDLGATAIERMEIEQSLAHGGPLAEPRSAPVTGLSRLMPSGRKIESDPNNTAGFVVWLDGDDITELSAEFKRGAKLALNGAEPEQHVSTLTYTYKLSDVSHTVVEVPVEAKALFAKSVGIGAVR